MVERCGLAVVRILDRRDEVRVVRDEEWRDVDEDRASRGVDRVDLEQFETGVRIVRGDRGPQR
jgi:hypothetical protein